MIIIFPEEQNSIAFPSDRSECFLYSSRAVWKTTDGINWTALTG
ncbi:MAG: hypothetical protein R3A12_00165 [Ignavibacteria bacterium]